MERRKGDDEGDDKGDDKGDDGEKEELQRELWKGRANGLRGGGGDVLCKGRAQKRERLRQSLLLSPVFSGREDQSGVFSKASSEKTVRLLSSSIEEAVYLDNNSSWKAKAYKSSLHDLIIKLRDEKFSDIIRRLVAGCQFGNEATESGDVSRMTVRDLIELKGKRLDEAAAAASGSAVEAGVGMAFPTQRDDVMALRSAFVKPTAEIDSAANTTNNGKQEGQWRLEKFSFGESLLQKYPAGVDDGVQTHQADKNGEEGTEQKRAIKKERSEKDRGNTFSNCTEKNESENIIEIDNENNNDNADQNKITMNDTQPEKDVHKVYVGGCPYWATEDDIAGFFEPYCGEILSIETLKFPDSGKFRGIAFITFAEAQAATLAIAYDGEFWEQCQLKIQKYKLSDSRSKQDEKPKFSGKREKIQGSTTAYIGNLHYDIDENEIREVFSDCNIQSIRFGTDTSGKFKGFAHIEFETEDDLEKAMRFDGSNMHGRPCIIHYSETKGKIKETDKQRHGVNRTTMKRRTYKKSRPVYEKKRKIIAQ